MSIAAPPEAGCSITHFRCKKDFFYKIYYGVVEQRACILSFYRVSLLFVLFYFFFLFIFKILLISPKNKFN